MALWRWWCATFVCGFLNFPLRVRVRFTFERILPAAFLGEVEPELPLRSNWTPPRHFIPSVQSRCSNTVHIQRQGHHQWPPPPQTAPHAFGPGSPTALSLRPSDCWTFKNIHYPRCRHLGFKWQNWIVTVGVCFGQYDLTPPSSQSNSITCQRCYIFIMNLEIEEKNDFFLATMGIKL